MATHEELKGLIDAIVTIFYESKKAGGALETFLLEAQSIIHSPTFAGVLFSTPEKVDEFINVQLPIYTALATNYKQKANFL